MLTIYDLCFATVLVRKKVTAFFVITLSLFSNLIFADAKTDHMMVDRVMLSEGYSMELDPAGKKIAGEVEFHNVMSFFHQAEKAIEAEDIEALMALYSDKYSNRNKRNKKFARKIWKKIFANFDNLSSRHSMNLINYEDQGKQYKLAVTECSGLLKGTQTGTDKVVTIDSWDKQRHILIYDGAWKLFGNAGKSAKRYGSEGADVHPLF